MESGLVKINDIDDEVLILTKDPISIVNGETTRSHTNEENKCDIVDTINDNENLYWLEEFTASLCSVIGNENYELFEYLLSTYQKHISKDCYKWQFLQPPKFAKLKNHIMNTLIFFHFCWRNMKERVSDDCTYLDKMTEIVRIYLDLEVISSVKDNDSFDKLSSKILHALHIYLDNSEEHVLKILLKSKCVTKKYSKIYSPVFEKYFSNLRNCGESITNFTYARYLIAFKLWKTIIDNPEKKAAITNMEEKLHSFSLFSHPKIDKILKKKPVRKRVFPKLKQGEVLSIDLTNDSEDAEQINIKKQKIKKKQQWLKKVKIHRKIKKPLSSQSKLVKVADAHSTESCENFEKSDSEATYSSFEKNIVSQKCKVTSSSLSQDIVHSNTTYVTSFCYDLKTCVLRQLDDREDISSQSVKESEICPISTTVGDHVCEASSEVWTDDNSADFEAPNAIASASSEVSTNLCKIPQEEICEEYNVFSNSLFERSFGPTKILNSLIDYNLMSSDSFMSDLVYSNFQAIDPNVLRKSPDKFDFEICNSFSEDPPLSFENEERIEMNDKFEKIEDSPTLIKFNIEVNEEPAETVEKSVEEQEQMKEEISSSSRKISKSGVQLPFKKRFYTNEEENLNIVNKDV